MAKVLLSYWRDQRGLTTLEYALLLGLVVAVTLTVWDGFGTRNSEGLEDTVARLLTQ